MASKRYIYANEFNKFFDVFLVDYWDKWLGLDLGKLDKDIIKSTDKESISESVLRQWGARAQLIILELTQEMPILDRRDA